MEISYIGLSCFRIKGKDATVVIDPFGKTVGLQVPVPSRFVADVLLITHDHPGHGNISAVGGSPKVVDCPGEYEIKGIGIQGVAAYHDAEQGEAQGSITIFALEVDGVVVAHLGDLAHALSEEQQERLGSIDVLLVPVGGGNSLSATMAVEVINQLEPKIVIPMHYKLPELKINLDDLQHFSSEMGIPNMEFVPKLSLGAKPATEDMKVMFLEARSVS
jgi:L-ascorbate metabolism protein UlaG (beta-lactamase superfamily)